MCFWDDVGGNIRGCERERLAMFAVGAAEDVDSCFPSLVEEMTASLMVLVELDGEGMRSNARLLLQRYALTTSALFPLPFAPLRA